MLDKKVTKAFTHSNQPSFWTRCVIAVSSGTLRVEKKCITGLMFLLTFLILLNVVTRYSGAPIYWIDESAVYSVVWLTFIGGSAMTRLRMDFAVSIVTDRLPQSYKKTAKVFAGIGVTFFAISLTWMCVLWFDPVGYFQSGFDAKALAGKTFNFLYTERTQTLGWHTWVIYLIIPIFSITMIIHSLANLLEDLGWIEPESGMNINLGGAEGIN